MKMKKLIVSAALLVAGLAQASAVNWALQSAVPGATDGQRIWAFIASDSSGSTQKTISQADAIALIEANDYAGLKAYNQKGGTLKDGALFTGSYTSDNASWGTGTEVSGYAIIFDTSDKNLDGVTKYMVTDVQTVKFTNSGDSKSFGITPSGTWTPITDAPEPTSGLLLLVGAGMLALRRKALSKNNFYTSTDLPWYNSTAWQPYIITNRNSIS